MRTIKSTIAAILVLTLVFSLSLSVFAYEKSYNSDIVDPLYVTDIEDQGESGNCLYYAIAATAESFVKKYYGKTADFDEDAISEQFNNEEKDFDRVVDNLAGALLGSIPGGETCAVSEVKIIRPSETDFAKKVKKAVKEYGAVTAVFSVCDEGMKCPEHYKKSDYSYYCPADECGENTHAVSIVGWDDDSETWLCKNSYGYEYGYAGMFRLGYAQALACAAAFTVSKGDSTAGIQEDLNWDNSYITAVYAQIELEGEGKNAKVKSMRAYGTDQDGIRHECYISLGYENDYFEISPPDSAFFSGDTACYLNGDKLAYGFTGGNDPRYEFDSESGHIGVDLKIKGAYEIVKFESSKYGLGYIKLTYNNSATRLIFAGKFDDNKIENLGEYKNAEELKAGVTQFESAVLPELKDSGKYIVLKFDGSYVFSDDAFDGQKYAAVKDGDSTLVLIAAESLVPEIDLTEMLGVSTGWLSIIIDILQNLVMKVSVK